MTRADLVRMSDSDLNDWCEKHDLHGCRDGSCWARQCIWCGEVVDEVMEEITKLEAQGDC